jgi:2-amino-4-hydroxy-6-hydroxymethyldihydropteridine diphosphokinase
MRYWLALGSNDQAEPSLDFACVELAKLGEVLLSARYALPPRSGAGVEYSNMAVRLDTDLAVESIRQIIYQLEDDAGRIRKSNIIRLDIDLIAWQLFGQSVTFDQHRFPLPMDVIIPMREIWGDFGSVISLIQP